MLSHMCQKKLWTECRLSMLQKRADGDVSFLVGVIRSLFDF